MLFVAQVGWLDRELRDAIAFLREENRTLKAQLAGRRLHVPSPSRRRSSSSRRGGSSRNQLELGSRITGERQTDLSFDSMLKLAGHVVHDRAQPCVDSDQFGKRRLLSDVKR